MKQPRFSLRRLWPRALAALLLLVASLAHANPPPDRFGLDHPRVKAVIALQNEVTAEWLAIEGVLGTAVGLDQNGQPELVVYVDKDGQAIAELVRSLPPQLRGIGVRAELTEKFRAYKRPGGGGGTTVSHTAPQTPPIQLGTSGGWRQDLANGYCCGGTLGALVQVNGIQYVLSNYHVLEADIVSGGNGIVATDGSSVIQPGLIDVSCNANNARNVATLITLKALPTSNVDAAVAQVTPGMVATNGAILQIGPISAQTTVAYLNQPVKKSGRTTALTRSKVSGLNATVSVAYDNECAGGAAFTKTFTGQIVLSNRRNAFLNGGDSGSLLVEDVATTPRPIGLLYAGSSTSAIANPIAEVLEFLGSKLGGAATMVGQ